MTYSMKLYIHYISMINFLVISKKNAQGFFFFMHFSFATIFKTRSGVIAKKTFISILQDFNI